MPSDTTLNVTAHPRTRTVFLRISDYGVNFEDVVSSLTQEFIAQGRDWRRVRYPRLFAASSQK